MADGLTTPPNAGGDAGLWIGVDLTNVQDQFEVIPTNKYLLRIVSCTRQAAKPGKFPSLRWQHQVVHGEFMDKKLSNFTSLSPDALWRLRDMITAHQYQPGPQGFNAVELYGKMAWAGVEETLYCQQCEKEVKSTPCNNCGKTPRRQNKITGWEPAVSATVSTSTS